MQENSSNLFRTIKWGFIFHNHLVQRLWQTYPPRGLVLFNVAFLLKWMLLFSLFLKMQHVTTLGQGNVGFMFSFLMAWPLTMMLINEKSRSVRNASHTCLPEWDQCAAFGSMHYGRRGKKTILNIARERRKKPVGEDWYNILGEWWVV